MRLELRLKVNRTKNRAIPTWHREGTFCFRPSFPFPFFSSGSFSGSSLAPSWMEMDGCRWVLKMDLWLDSNWSNGRAQLSEKFPTQLHLFGTVLNSKTERRREGKKHACAWKEKRHFSAPSFRKPHWQFFSSQQGNRQQSVRVLDIHLANNTAVHEKQRSHSEWFTMPLASSTIPHALSSLSAERRSTFCFRSLRWLIRLVRSDVGHSAFWTAGNRGC